MTLPPDHSLAHPSTAATRPAAIRPREPLPLRLQVEDLWYRFAANGNSWVLRGISLDLQERELVGLLGPSGCGKTSLLRLIAGFVRPQRGRILLDGREVSSPRQQLPPERRGLGIVFQDDALFPHLSAWDNACFGLLPGQDRSRVPWLLELLGLSGLESRYPHALSGGQRQRLAIARALAPSPRLVLLDEPFSNLDAEVRQRLRSELPGVLTHCGATGLMVTHDPEEALAICDRVAVLHNGVLEQCTEPRQLAASPATGFVARFVLQGNLLAARRLGPRQVATALGKLCCRPGADGNPATSSITSTTPLQVLVRPEQFRLRADDNGEASVCAREFLGKGWLYQIQLQQLRLRLWQPLEQALALNQRCSVVLDPDAQLLLYPQRLPLVSEHSA